MYENLKHERLDFLFASRYEKPKGGSDDDNLITLLGISFSLSLEIFFSNLKFRTYCLHL